MPRINLKNVSIEIAQPVVKAAGSQDLDLIKTATSPDIYVLIPSGRYKIRDEATWQRWGFTAGQVRTISQAQMNGIPRGPDITRAMRPFGNPTVYVVDHAQTRAVTTPDAFLLSGYSWSEVSNVEPMIINLLPATVILDTPPAVRSPKDGKVYSLYDGKKHHIPNADVMNHWGFDGYVTSPLIDTYPTGAPLTKLVKVPGAPTVWVVDNQKRRPLPSPDALLLNNFSWSNLTDVSQTMLERLPVGDPFYAPTTVSLPGNPQRFYVDGGVRYPIADDDTFNSWGFGRFGATVSAALANYPIGSKLTRLPRTADGAVWRVKDGQYRLIPSEGIFNGYGFSWADVTTIPIASFWPLVRGNPLDYTTDTLQGYAMPATTGFVGKEQHIWTTNGETSESAHYAINSTPFMGESIVLQNGVAGTGAFGRISPEIEKYYITMRWNYCTWYEDPNDLDSFGRPSTKTRDCNNTAKNWHKGKKVIVSNPRTGRKIVTAIGESGPAIWITRERGVVSGLSPEATDYIVGDRYFNGRGNGTGGDNLIYGFSVDQSLPLGPLTY